MAKRKRGRPNLWHQGRLLRGLWLENRAKTGIGLRKQTEKWADEGLPKGAYPRKVSADALLKAVRRSVEHRILDADGKARVIPTVLTWDYSGMAGGAQSGGSATTSIVAYPP